MLQSASIVDTPILRHRLNVKPLTERISRIHRLGWEDAMPTKLSGHRNIALRLFVCRSARVELRVTPARFVSTPATHDHTMHEPLSPSFIHRCLAWSSPIPIQVVRHRRYSDSGRRPSYVGRTLGLRTAGSSAEAENLAMVSHDDGVVRTQLSARQARWMYPSAP
jgi:hypothetical protein